MCLPMVKKLLLLWCLACCLAGLCLAQDMDSEVDQLTTSIEQLKQVEQLLIQQSSTISALTDNLSSLQVDYNNIELQLTNARDLSNRQGQLMEAHLKSYEQLSILYNQSATDFQTSTTANWLLGGCVVVSVAILIIDLVFRK